MVRYAPLIAFTLSLTCSSCGSARSANKADTFGWVEDGDNYAPPGEGGFNVRWSKQLTDRREARYVPVEYATAGFDPQRKRVYVGTTEGNFFAFRIDGRRLWLYDAFAQIESQPAIDDVTGEVYLLAMDGFVHALDVDGKLRWKTKLPGSLRTTPLLAADAIYIVGEDDGITAIAREDGQVLWAYEKQPTDEITISGHAGLLLEEGRLYAAFTDGAVAALNPLDGRLLWEIEMRPMSNASPAMCRSFSMSIRRR